MAHTKGPWWFNEFHGNPEDIALGRKHGIEPVPALSNDGSRFLMSGEGNDVKRIALVDCQTAYKRGKGHEVSCAERDDNARLIAAAPDLYEAVKVSHECGAPMRASLYDEEGVEGWRWRHPDGREWTEVGDWMEAPPMHPVCSAALTKATGAA